MMRCAVAERAPERGLNTKVETAGIKKHTYGELGRLRIPCKSYGSFCRVQAAHNNNTILFIIIIRGFLLFIASSTAVLTPFVLLVALNTVDCNRNTVSVRNFTVNYLYHYKSIE